jgi:hypothetical protein
LQSFDAGDGLLQGFLQPGAFEEGGDAFAGRFGGEGEAFFELGEQGEVGDGLGAGLGGGVGAVACAFARAVARAVGCASTRKP